MNWQASHRQLSSLALAAKAPGSSPSALPGFLSRALPGSWSGSWSGSLLAAGLALVALVLLALGGSARAQVDQNYLEQWLKSSSNNALSATQRTQAEFTTPAHVWNVSRSDNGSVQVVRSPEQWYTLVRLGGELKFVLLINATDAKTTAVQIADAALARSLASWRTVSCARWELKPVNCSVVQSRFRPIFLYVMLGTLVHPLHLLMKMVLPGLAGCFGPWWYWLAWV